MRHTDYAGADFSFYMYQNIIKENLNEKYKNIRSYRSGGVDKQHR